MIKKKEILKLLLQNLLAERNKISKIIGQLKSSNKDASKEVKEVEEIKKKIITLKELENIKDNELKSILTRLPNLPHKSVPFGEDENNNVLYKEWGKKPKFNFNPKIHYDIGENLGLINFEIASKLSGSRFVILKNKYQNLKELYQTSCLINIQKKMVILNTAYLLLLKVIVYLELVNFKI